MRAAVALSLFLMGCIPDYEVPVQRVDDDELDQDNDGFTPNDGDCDDDAAAINPEADDLCDGIDNDCDDHVDEGTVCRMVDTFDQEAYLDVLFVIDNSLSMGAEQARVQAAAESFVPWVFSAPSNTHIGVITTDMVDPDHQGRLVVVNGASFASAAMNNEQAVAWFQSAVAVGTSGSGAERAREAISAALNEHRDTSNAGFFQEDARLMLVVVSDEDDSSSEPSVTGFVNMLEELKGDAGFGFYAIVGPEFACIDDAYGQAHLEVVDRTVGSTLWICEQEYGPYLYGVGQDEVSSSLDDHFKLQAVPEPHTWSIKVTLPSGYTETLGDDAYDWISDENAFAFEIPPPAGSTIRIEYKRKP